MTKDLLIDIKENNQNSIRERVREFVANALRTGAMPQAISEELVYIATEMSLHIADNKLCVIPILLESMTRSAHDFTTPTKVEAQDTEEFDFDAVSCELFH